MESWSLCGADVDPGGRRYGCVADPVCIFACEEPPIVGGAPQYDGLCANDDISLPGDINFSFVQDGECTAPTKCEVQCGIGFYPLGAGATAYCGPCGTLGIERTGCPAQRYDPRGCPITQFFPCCFAE